MLESEIMQLLATADVLKMEGYPVASRLVVRAAKELQHLNRSYPSIARVIEDASKS